MYSLFFSKCVLPCQRVVYCIHESKMKPLTVWLGFLFPGTKPRQAALDTWYADTVGITRDVCIIRTDLLDNHCGLKGRRVGGAGERVRGRSRNDHGPDTQHHGVRGSTWLGRCRAILTGDPAARLKDPFVPWDTHQGMRQHKGQYFRCCFGASYID